MTLLTLEGQGILEVPVVYGCNFACNYCAHLSPLMKVSPVPVEQIEQQFKDWQPRLAPRVVRIMGGEPLLHPGIEQIVEVFATWWCDGSCLTTISICTNGSMLDRMPPSFFELLAKHRVTLKVTLHHPNLRYRITSFLESIKTPLLIVDAAKDNDFKKYYDIIDGKPQLYQGESQASHSVCYVKRACFTLSDNRLYHCSILAYFRKAYELGIIDDKRILNYTPGTPDMMDTELKKWYYGDFSKVCEVCPDKNHPVLLSEKWNDRRLANA